MMNDVNITHFDAYFEALHSYPPYPWQRRLAEQVVAGNWPGAIDLPTGSGKTACIDIAIFALACQASLHVEQRTAPRRVFFCVNRRVIVDEAFQRARRVAKSLWQAERAQENSQPVLRQVATALRSLAGTKPGNEAPPLDVLELRGGIYRDNRWARSMTQPTIIGTTIDQLGSRLLFRGYGVSGGASPIQAALIAYDSLILLDEAHISEPFRQTLDHVHRYLDPQKWTEQSIGVRPVTVVPMTATPNQEMSSRGLIQLDAEDRKHQQLAARLQAPKPAVLRGVKNVVREMVTIAESLDADKPLAVGIIVNRIATARSIYDQLRALQLEPNEKKRKIPCDAAIELVIGSMRPLDRDSQSERLGELVGPRRPQVTQKYSFIVATQCLEVGADYDFDMLITQCASLDALRQRFGRLNRAGRDIDTKAVIVTNEKEIKPEDKLDDDKPSDPIYGNALARTWNWLNAHATDGVINMGIDALDGLLKEHGEDSQPSKSLLAPSASLNAPVMLPAYLDFWCQTSPQPVPDPDVSLFIHGRQRSEPDVQVCWRADLIEDGKMTREHWCDVVSLLPPTTAECMSVPISRLRLWLSNQMDSQKDHGDVLGVAEPDGDPSKDINDRTSVTHPGVLWRGISKSVLLESPDDLRPGDTLVLPTTADASSELGHLPQASLESTDDSDGARPSSAIHDVAEAAFARARDRSALRLHPSLLGSTFPVNPAMHSLVKLADSTDSQSSMSDWRVALKAAANSFSDGTPNNLTHKIKVKDHSLEALQRCLEDLTNQTFRLDGYPDKRGVVLTARQRLHANTGWFMSPPPLDDGDDQASRYDRNENGKVSLNNHTQHVTMAVKAAITGLPLGVFAKTYELAATFHDLGKADERFQAMLRRTDRSEAWLLAGVSSALLAKSDGVPLSPFQRALVRDRAGLPDGFRHEMLSVQLAEWSPQLPKDHAARDLILHLIAAHHGHARPFAPVVPDDELPAVVVNDLVLTHEQRAEMTPPHRLDSGIAERFWTLTRRYGWWGLAYLEATLRLSDQQASADEAAGVYDDETVGQPMEVTR